jgi:hypothetical protein
LSDLTGNQSFRSTPDNPIGRVMIVTHEEVARISALSPVHRLTIESFLESGRWILKKHFGETAPGTGMNHATVVSH